MEYHYFDTREIAKLAQEHYDIQSRVEPLNGYDEANYLLTASDRKKYILKLANDSHGIHFLEAQVLALKHLSDSTVASQFQRCISNTRGEKVTRIIKYNTNYYIRILTYLAGIFWVDCAVKSSNLLFDLGSFLGKMDTALSSFLIRRFTAIIRGTSYMPAMPGKTFLSSRIMNNEGLPIISFSSSKPMPCLC